MNWQTEIKFLKGVGPKKAELFKNELKIHTIKDLLYYFPYKYVDKTKFYNIKDLTTDLAFVQLKGKINNIEEIGQGNKKRLVAKFVDDSGTIELVWFQGIKWIKKKLKIGEEYVIFGKPNFMKSNYISIAHPELETLEQYKTRKIKPGLHPYYSTTEKLKKNYIFSRTISELISKALDQINPISDFLPKYLIERLNLLSLSEAIKNIHFPQNYNLLKAAEYRLKFDEFFINQLALIKQKKIRTEKLPGYVFERIGNYFNDFYFKKLNFELTNAQKRVLKEIRKDFKSSHQANRLLQGDVGSGKTIIALMSMLIALDNGYQTCLMAPTEILAQQHYKNFEKMLNGLDINLKLLTGSTKTKERKLIYKQLQNGEIQILIGTHALIEDTVKFHKLGLAIIDEQHRFGVAQRAKLWKKGKIPPHIIVMTATPIPRTLSMTLYGDLDVSIIDELPAGRKPIKTIHLKESERYKLYKFLEKEISKGRQVYIVYPLIKESEKLDYKNIEEGYKQITQFFPQPKYRVGILHGQMRPEEKEYQMQLFVSGQTQILVSTTVIEVGVNVPNATVMVIESAERFGLSQLHQLRGRVGRGAQQSFCFLITKNNLSPDAKKRINTMTQTNDGFKIAEVDMKLRGPGDIFGTAQSGFPFHFKIADLSKDNSILILAREIAQKILNEDPNLSSSIHKKLKAEVYKEIIQSPWGFIS